MHPAWTCMATLVAYVSKHPFTPSIILLTSLKLKSHSESRSKKQNPPFLCPTLNVCFQHYWELKEEEEWETGGATAAANERLIPRTGERVFSHSRKCEVTSRENAEEFGRPERKTNKRRSFCLSQSSFFYNFVHFFEGRKICERVWSNDVGWLAGWRALGEHGKSRARGEKRFINFKIPLRSQYEILPTV